MDQHYKAALDYLQDKLTATEDELQAARQELAYLREFEREQYEIVGVWAPDSDSAAPGGCFVAIKGGEGPVPLKIDASGLVAEVLRRAARAECRRIEMAGADELGALLARVPVDYTLEHPEQCAGGDYWAGWHRWGADEYAAEANGPTREAAIRGATQQLLGLADDPPADEQLPGVTVEGNVVRSEGDES